MANPAVLTGPFVSNVRADLVPRGAYVQNQVIVKFKNGINPRSALGREVSVLQRGQRLEVLAQQTGVDTTVVDVLDGIEAGVLEINSGQTVPATVFALSANPDVDYVEPNYLMELEDTVAPTDGFFGQQWGLNNDGASNVPGDSNFPAGIAGVDSRACDAWNTSTGSGVVVAVIDTGIRTTHVEVDDNLWVNPGETAGNLIDDDGNGYVDDINGADFRFTSTDDGDVTDENSHGGNVASIIGAERNNTGIVGLAYDCQLMILKVAGASNSVELAAVVKAVDYATDNGANVINLSLSSNSASRALKDAIDRAADSNILCVCASGNQASDLESSPRFPAAYKSPNIVTVGAHSPADTVAEFSNIGATAVDLFAPGGDTADSGATAPTGGSGYFILGISHTSDTGIGGAVGTSQAAPHVAGAAALLYANFAGISYSDVRKRLMESANAGAGNYAGQCQSGGRLDANAALSADITHTIFLDGIAPEGGSEGTQVTLTGVGFGSTTGTVSLTIGVNPAVNLTIDSWDENTIMATIPSGVATGTGTIAVTNAGSDTSNTADFTTNGAGVVYQVTQQPFSPRTFTTGAIASLSGLNPGGASPFGIAAFTVSSGFHFEFYGTDIADALLAVTNFGIAQFDTSTFTLSNQQLPSATNPDNLLAPFWGTLHPTANTEVRLEGDGTFLAIEWKNVGYGLPVFVSGSQVGYLAVGEGTFQLEMLDNGNNDIFFHFIDTDFGHPDADEGGAMTIGIENADGSEGTQWTAPVPSGTTLRFRP
ncbi:MAG: S8 family serine peptidase [Vulcanimicrobiota bacterium]